MSKTKLLLDVIENLHGLADSLQIIADAMMQGELQDSPVTKSPEETEEQPEPKHDVTLEEVRAVLARKSQEGFTAQVKSIIERFGATKLSEIDSKDFEEVLLAAEELTND
ncbi:rRNA biogenesis protein rrp5 [Listeria monocytogenes]|nr:rRNA biogenesis protein rrp5 [Listeria monocytogenes]EDO0154739.1 rRNA biogenesis protein rrp5 [Listeria monocytogenes]EDO0664214.1 rRNA biogenesis protein rrp5 [Listeria monocytogenes]EGF3687402.1 rRNA biogenesis protein rrp5 [Listeria monocytogenes]EGF3711445.1 rRNA biogenesis protein rrp5 [Listeria monocytogenes]